MTIRFDTLEQWLNWQNALHPQAIDLGLERCLIVAKRLGLLPLPFPVITVAGTNGKGSSVALLDSILSRAGYRIGRYTSPHLHYYNERIAIDGQVVSDTQLCEAFAEIETARREVSLTYFEWGTLAAAWLFMQHKVEGAVLEVGLGGRLDAVNTFNPLVSLVTAIGIDHVEWLGTDRESIALEKAGIFRSQRPAICSDPKPPQSLINYAKQLNTPLYCLERDFHYQKTDECWTWQSVNQTYTCLPLPHLPGDFQLQNAAGVLMTVMLLQPDFSIPLSAICQGLSSVTIPGRFQIIEGTVPCILDVAHNPLGVQVLRQTLQTYPCSGRTQAIVGILQDKDSKTMLSLLRETINCWHVAPLLTPRSSTIERLLGDLQQLGVTKVHSYPSIGTAYEQVLQQVQAGDRIVVFGSFHTVSEVFQAMSCC